MFCYFIHILTCYCVGNLLILFGYLYFVGHGCSWMQDNSTYNDIVTNNKRNHGPLHSVFPPRSAESAEVSSVKDLFEFICSGPLIDKLGFTPQTIADSIDKWLENGSQVCKLFQLNDLYLTTPQKARIYHYYIPVFLWCEKQISDHRSTFKDGDDIPPLVVFS
ncbi:putative glycerate 3-kinase [Helianthus annuus]|nr:putative glycerate 3-kinase [Helianthus annuus]KAJ0775964.1 putative glycerate 3-kinase [Helianthus annuus]